MIPQPYRRYAPETEVQEKSGRVKKKVKGIDGDYWIGRNRFNWMKKHKQELGPNDRVFHIDGDKENDDPANLVKITFTGVKYNIKHSRVVWEPKAGQTHYEQYKVKRET